MYLLTHRVLIPFLSWIFLSLTQVLRWIELPFENEAAESKPRHRCDVPDDSIPPLFDDPEPQPRAHWKNLLAKAEAQGRVIRPLTRRRKPLEPTVQTCPNCQAPRAYLESFGHDPQGWQKLRCRVCRYQFAPERSPRPQLRPRCPFCERALEIYKHRTDFDVYRCSNPDCTGRQVLGKRYKWRNYRWDPNQLQVAQPTGRPVVDLRRLRYGAQILTLAIHSVIGLGLSLRQAQRNLWAMWQLNISPEAIRQWLLAVAVQLAPLLGRIPLPLSGCVAVDESYIRIRGRWFYLFTAMDAIRGHIPALHLSPKRSAFAAAAILRAVSRRYGKRPWTLITDGAPIYRIAIEYLRARRLTSLSQHHVVIGLEKTTDEPQGARQTKNRLERLFGTYKAHYKRHKSFQTFQGALAHAILYMAFYNHLKPHDAHRGQPPVPLTTASGQPINDWQAFFSYLATL